MVIKRYIIFAVIFLVSYGVLAQEQIFFIGEELGVGARPMGMGGAYVGISDDYAAIYWNPAGMGQMRRMELNLSFSHNGIENKAEFLDVSTKGETSFSRLNSIGFVFPVPTYRGSLVFGIGYNQVRDFDNVLEIEAFNDRDAAFPYYVVPTYGNEWTTDIYDSLHQKESLIEEGSRSHFSLSGAIEIQENFFLGATLNFIGGKSDYSLRFEESDVYNIYTLYDENARNMSDLDYWIYDQNIVSEFSATNLKLGALYRFGRSLRVGATITTPTKYRIKETWRENQTEYYDTAIEAAILEDEGNSQYDIQEPYTFSLGASFKLLNLMVSGGLDFKDWSQAKFRSDPPIGGVTKNDVNIRLKHDLQAVTNVRLGAEMYIPLIKARVRAGYFNDPTPYKEVALRPNKEYLSGGLSLLLDKQVMFDLALVHGNWKQETRDDLTNAPTLEDITFDKVIGTLSVRF